MKKIFFLLFALIFCSFVYSQAVSNSTEVNAENKKEDSIEIKNEIEQVEPEQVDKTKTETSDFGFYFGPELVISNIGIDKSQSLGVSTNIGLEYEYKAMKYLSFIPSLDVSIFHYNFSGNASTGLAYISAIENRTALSLAFLLDIPLMARFDINSWVLSVGGGLALFLRGAFLEPGVKPDDLSGSGRTAKETVKLINSYFWKKGRFFYPSLAFKTEYIFKSGWKAGLKFKAFIPIYNAWDSSNQNFADSHIFQISVILHPAKN